MNGQADGVEQSEKNISIQISELETYLNKQEKYGNLNLENLDKILSPEELNKTSNIINDGGKISLNLSESNLSSEEKNKIVTNLKLAGFLKVILSEDGKNISGTKKTWNKNKTKKSENPWKTMKIQETTDLIVEDELIDPFDNYQKFAKADDCMTKPKPCKNCTCGRAEENKQAQTKVDPNFKSDCGKCYLGDAFRCAGCPYRGKPAFEPGDKIQFKNEEASANGSIEAEKTNINVKDKKVKIDI
jgi:anamorsin